MRILLVNVPDPAIGSRIPDDHLPPLGLLAIGGPLIDDGYVVRLVDGEFGPMSTESLVAEAVRFRPDAVLFGHSGSTSGHPVITEVAKAVHDGGAAGAPGGSGSPRRVKRWHRAHAPDPDFHRLQSTGWEAYGAPRAAQRRAGACGE